MNKKRCVVSFANGNGNYVNGLARLNESLRNNFDGDFLGFIGEASVGAPLHSENPYAFKLYCLEKAMQAGYEQLLWLDSSCFAIKNISPVFDHIEEHGYIMQDAGHFIGEWTNDTALSYFHINRNEVMDVRCYGNAGFLGLNTNNEKAMLFFQRWVNSMEAGMFKGAWNNDDKTESPDESCKGHRHDLSCGSIIRYTLGMNLQPGDEWLQYAGLFDETANDKIYIKAQGI
jgi:hypothetical protein